MEKLSINPSPGDPKSVKPPITMGTGAAPRFGSDSDLRSPGLVRNLKDFLSERPVKLPRNARPRIFYTEGLNSSFRDSLKEFFRRGPRVQGASDSRMLVEHQPEFRVFFRNLRDLIAPPKLPPLNITSKPVPVRSIWGPRTQFKRAQALSVAVHVLLAVILIVPLIWLQEKTQPVMANVDVVDISPYILKLPPGKKRAGGGGGGGERKPVPPTRGKLPRFSMTQFTAPMAVPRNLHPKLPMQATLLGPPNLKLPSPNQANFGDPLAKLMADSAGPGGGSGIGTGEGGGIGSGTGGGLGPGSGGGTGGGIFRPGTGGVGYPSCLYCPEPQYSEDARKAKYQGTVVLQVIIQPDGHATDIRVVKSPGLGLDAKAVEAVRTWRFKPALGPNGKPVATLTPIEVTFRLL
jgi:periplasmic protein TonB